ncbi:cysteine hydrolase [Oligoflexia bacterium]|nr:cysteine hydrolase [Oligoflexia bacterium]
MSKALIIVDIQNDYFPGGAYELVGISAAASTVSDLLSYFRENDLPVFHVQHLEKAPDAEFFIPNTPGVEIYETVTPKSTETVVQKHAPNSFIGTNLEQLLRENNISQLVLCGAMSHMCIDATTRAALDLEFDCTVIHDACATVALEFNGSQIPALQVQGAFMQALEDAGAEMLDLKKFLENN